eukprot:7541612-Pyramimonas_sp.AAC.1
MACYWLIGLLTGSFHLRHFWGVRENLGEEFKFSNGKGSYQGLDVRVCTRSRSATPGRAP